MTRRVLALAAALALAACVGMGQGQSALISWKRATEDLRGLEFKRPFSFYWVERSEIPGILGAIFEASYVTTTL